MFVPTPLRIRMIQLHLQKALKYMEVPPEPFQDPGTRHIQTMQDMILNLDAQCGGVPANLGLE